MTYHLEPFLEKITSPVILLFPDGSYEKCKNGKEISSMTFHKKYNVISIYSTDNYVEIKLENAVSYEGSTSFF